MQPIYNANANSVGDQIDHSAASFIAGDGNNDDAQVIDLKEIWAALFRNRLWIALIMLSFLALGVIATLLMTPIYQAGAAVQIDQEAKKVLGTEQTDASASIQDAERFLKTQVGVINSRAVSRAVAQELRLFNNDKFLKAMNETGTVKATAQVPIADAKREKVLELLRKNLFVELPPDSRIVRIGFSSPDPALTARVANSYAENYIRSNLQRKFDASSYARDFLRAQLDESQARLAEAERAAVDYARRSRIIDAAGGTDSDGKPTGSRSLTTSTLVELSSEAASATAKRIAAEQRWRRVQKGQVLNLPEVLANLAIQNLLRERAELNASLEQESQRRREDFPSIRQSQAKIAETDRQINAIASNIRSSIKAEYDIALANEKALEGRVNEIKSSAFSEQSESIQLSILRREADTFRQQYEYLLRRFNELNAESGVQSNNITLVDRAAVPLKPSSPRLLLNLGLAFLGGLALSGLFVFGRQNFFDTLRTPDDLKRVLGLPLLGVIPKFAADAEPLEILADPKSPLSESYSSLRSSLALALPHGVPRAMAFVSTGASEGKSMACYATAIGFGRSGKRVLVIDLDLRRPNQHNYMGLPNKTGMSDVLSGSKTLQEVTSPTKHKGVSFIAAGPIPPNPAELLEPAVLKNIVQNSLENFDLILIDSAPVLGLADAVIIGSALEGIVYLVESGRNLPKAVRAAVHRLQHSKVRIFGAILTKFDANQAGYGYAYDAAYAYRHED